MIMLTSVITPDPPFVTNYLSAPAVIPLADVYEPTRVVTGTYQPTGSTTGEYDAVETTTGKFS